MREELAAEIVAAGGKRPANIVNPDPCGAGGGADRGGEKGGDDASLTFHRAVIASNGILDVLWRGLEWLEVIVSRSGCTYRSAAGVAEFSLSAKLRAAVSADEG